MENWRNYQTKTSFETSIENIILQETKNYLIENNIELDEGAIGDLAKKIGIKAKGAAAGLAMAGAMAGMPVTAQAAPSEAPRPAVTKVAYEVNTQKLEGDLKGMFDEAGTTEQINNILGPGATERFIKYRMKEFDGSEKSANDIKNDPTVDLIEWVKGEKAKAAQEKAQVQDPEAPGWSPDGFDASNPDAWK